MDENKVKEVLKECDALLEGHFVLSSGLHSPAYVQCALLLQHPGSAGLICAALADLWRDERPDVIIGPALGGILVAYETARALGAKALFTERKEGVMMLRRGFTISPNDRIVVSEDIVTSGKSAKETIEVIREAGGNVIGVTSIGNRNAGNPFDLPFRSLVCFDFPVYQPDDCPLCRDGVTLVKPGSRHKV
ncbi:MAG: orotate phosphoribosyltransferase [Planctomycetes bacterium]|nr:orotate phosphoribosyltransferase [Planctomycetota bacterium]